MGRALGAKIAKSSHHRAGGVCSVGAQDTDPRKTARRCPWVCARGTARPDLQEPRGRQHAHFSLALTVCVRAKNLSPDAIARARNGHYPGEMCPVGVQDTDPFLSSRRYSGSSANGTETSNLQKPRVLCDQR